jgi:hypothetical protein
MTENTCLEGGLKEDIKADFLKLKLHGSSMAQTYDYLKISPITIIR